MIRQSGPWCDVCNDPILLDVSINPFRCKGIDQELHCHDKCKDTLIDVGRDWTKLPDGPLRKAFEDASHQRTNNGI